MREKTIEQKLVTEVKKKGGLAIKFVPPVDGFPDRLVILPFEEVARYGFVEVKAPGKKPRPLQVSRMNLLRKMGCKVFVLDGIEQIGGIIDAIQTS